MNIDIKHTNHILVSPLDWGLGHATRCIPLINYFLECGKNVSIAGNGPSLELLKLEYPQLTFFEIPGFQVAYPRNKHLFIVKLAFQSPRIFSIIKRENRAILNILDQQNIDLIVSDNRYGCRSTNCRSVFLGHQLNLALPKSLNWVSALNKKLIRKFDECWVPDFEGIENLSGTLSHGNNGIKLNYLGPLSRFEKSTQKPKFKYKFLALLSGPQPQKSIFKNLLENQFYSRDFQVAFALGNPGNLEFWSEKNISYYGHLKGRELNDLILESEYIICRSGYSSIMDLQKLNKPAFIIPTPGQTEQEYLGNYLDGRFGFKKIDQNKLEHFQFLN